MPRYCLCLPGALAWRPDAIQWSARSKQEGCHDIYTMQTSGVKVLQTQSLPHCYLVKSILQWKYIRTHGAFCLFPEAENLQSIKLDQLHAWKCWVIMGLVIFLCFRGKLNIALQLPFGPTNKPANLPSMSLQEDIMDWEYSKYFDTHKQAAGSAYNQWKKGQPLLLGFRTWNCVCFAPADDQEDPDDAMEWMYTYCTYDGMEWITGKDLTVNSHTCFFCCIHHIGSRP